MSSDGDAGDARREALEAARRVYDRQVSELENIDDKAVQTSRTAVLILGFVAAGLTAAGPSIADDIHLVTFLHGVLGTLTLVASAFVSVGVYTVTQYNWELEPADLEAARHAPRGRWLDAATDSLDEASEDIEQQLVQNASYLEVSQLLLVFGSAFFLLGTIYAVIHRSYGIEPTIQALVLGLLITLSGVVARVKFSAT
jgi:hypothetical protein